MDSVQHSYRKTMSCVGLLYGGLLVITLLVQSFFSVGVHLWLPSLEASGWYLWLISYVPLYLAVFPLFLLAARLLPSGAPPARRGASFLVQGRLLVAAFGALYIGNLVTTLILTGVGLLRGTPVESPTMVIQQNSDVWATLIFGCIVAPVGEEIMFRKVLYDKIGKYGEAVYVLTGAALFGLFHGNFSQMLYAALVGGVLCLAYARTGELFYTIAVHVLLNLVGMVISPMLIENQMATAVLSVFIYGCIAFALVLAVRFRRYSKLLPGAALTGAHPIRNGIFNFGMLTNAILCLGMAVIVLFPSLLPLSGGAA